MAKKKHKKKKESKLRERLHWVSGNIMVIIAVVLVIAAFGGAYYFVIAPNLVSKPFIEKPSLPEGFVDMIKSGDVVIGTNHINYIINEIGAYKLKAPFRTKKIPVIEFFIEDINKRYYSYVNEHIPVTKEGNPKDEDLVIEGEQEIIAGILESDNVMEAVKEAKDNGDIKVELIADMKTLAAKGYLSLYDSLR